MNKTAKAILIIVVLALVVWAISSPDKSSISGEAIKIGIITPLSGIFADYGENMRGGIEAAIASSSEIKLIFEDEKCEPKDAVSAYHKLVDIDKVSFIIGPGCGSPQEAVVPLLAQNGVVVMVPSAASKELFIKSGGNFYNIQYSLEDESKFNAEKMLALGHKKVAIITYANAFSKTHADSFRANFKGTIVSDQVIQDNNADLLPYLTKIKAAKADAIYAPDIAFFFAGATGKLKQLGIGVPVFTTYVAELPAVIPVVEDVVYSFPANLDDPHGAVYGLSKQAAATLVPAVIKCSGDASCVKDTLASSGKFDDNGVYKRELVLKQIKDGKTVMFNQ